MRSVFVIAMVLGIAFAVAPARAEFVIVDPPVVRTCRTHKTWRDMTTCLAQHGTMKVLRAAKGLQLVHVEKTLDTGERRDLGIYLFVERGGAWHIAGMFPGGGTSSWELLAFEPHTIGKHTGYRIEIGVAFASTVSHDGATSVPALWRLRRTLYCAGFNHSCPDATLACEVLVRGKAMYAFRGKAEVDAQAIMIRGDRSKAGPCAPAERVFHGWPTTKGD